MLFDADYKLAVMKLYYNFLKGEVIFQFPGLDTKNTSNNLITVCLVAQTSIFLSTLRCFLEPTQR